MASEKTIAVIGYGTIGESFAYLFAEKGYRVKVSDVREDVQELIDATNARLEANAPRIERAESVADAVAGAFLVQENGPEKLDFKQQMAAQIFEANPDAILASSSSALLPSDIARQLPNEQAANLLIAHPFNPPRILPLIELVPGERTSDETMQAAREFYDGLGKAPVTLNKEIEGYIASRFQKRVLDEAVNQTTPQGFGATLKFIKLSFENIKDVPSPDYSSEGAQAAAEKVEAAYGRGATQEAKDKRDNYLERVSGALAGRE